MSWPCRLAASGSAPSTPSAGPSSPRPATDVGRIVERAALLVELAGGPLSQEALRWLDDAFTRLKLDPERGPPPGDVATHQAFAEYQAGLASRGAIDLDDLVARAVPTLQRDAGLLSRWRERAAVLFVDEAQDLDRCQLELALLLAGDRRDIFLVGDDDQTIYAWRLADVRRVLGLAARLPGLRRVDLETNHRCAPEVVLRASRLVAHNRERFDKVIRASPSASGSVTLLPDEGDAVARARFLLTTWPGTAETGTADPPGSAAGGEMGPAGTPVMSGSRAVLARTNSELVPFAAVALELGIPYQVEDDGLLLGQPALLAAVDRAIVHAGPDGMSLPVLARAIHETGLVAETGAALLAWAAPYGRLADLRDELRARASAREKQGSPRPCRSALRRAHPRDLPRHEGPRVGPRGLHRARRGHLPGRAGPAGGAGPGARPGGGAPPGLRGLDPGAAEPHAGLRPRCSLALPVRGLRCPRAGPGPAVAPRAMPEPAQRTLRRSTE